MADRTKPDLFTDPGALARIQRVTGLDPREQMSPLQVGMGGLRAVDAVTGAPIRAGIGAAQKGGNPWTAMAAQFAEDPDRAPTGEDIVKAAGMEAGALRSAAGLGMDIASDPTNIIPGKALLGMGMVGSLKHIKRFTKAGENKKVAKLVSRAKKTRKQTDEMIRGFVEQKKPQGFEVTEARQFTDPDFGERKLTTRVTLRNKQAGGDIAKEVSMKNVGDSWKIEITHPTVDWDKGIRFETSGDIEDVRDVVQKLLDQTGGDMNKIRKYLNKAGGK